MFSRYFLFITGVATFVYLSSAATLTESIVDVLEQPAPDPPEALFNTNETDFNVLTNLILAANLEGFLDEDLGNGFTLFAPDDTAFAQTAMDLGINATSEREVYENLFLFLSRNYRNPVSALQRVLAYHVLPGKMKFPSSNTATQAETMAFDAVLELRGIARDGLTLRDLNPYQPDPEVVSGRTDFEASNGIVHVIDRMLFFEPLELEASPDITGEDESIQPAESVLPEASLDPESIPPFSEETVLDAPDDDTLLEGFNPIPTKTATPSRNTHSEMLEMQATPEYPEESAEATLVIGTENEAPFSVEDAMPVVTTGGNSPVPTEEDRPLSESDVPIAANEPSQYSFYTSESIGEGENVIATEESTPSLLGTDMPVPVDGSIFMASGEPSADDVDPVTSSIGTTPQSFYVPDTTPEAVLPANPYDTGPMPLEEFQPIATYEVGTDSFYIDQDTEESPEDVASPSPEYEPIASGNCFPLSSFVHLENGSDIRLSQLNAGHVIRASESSVSMVYLFTHKKHTGIYDFVRIVSDADHVIVLTKGHYLYANGKLKAADNIKIGDTLRTLDGPARVKSISAARDYGLFAPHTMHGDLVVNRVVTSSYTTVMHPVIAHVVLWPIRALVHIGVAKEPLGATLYDGVAGLFR